MDSKTIQGAAVGFGIAIFVIVIGAMIIDVEKEHAVYKFQQEAIRLGYGVAGNNGFEWKQPAERQ